MGKVHEKGPGDVKYSGKPRKLEETPEGKPNLRDMRSMVGGEYGEKGGEPQEHGVNDNIGVDSFEGEPDYSVKAESQTGDDGKG